MRRPGIDREAQPGEPAVPGEPGARKVPAAPRGILRFVLVERVAHWLYALLFLVCLVSGLLMWIPATREWMGGARLGVSQRHAAAGFAMVVLPLLLMVILDRKKEKRPKHEDH